MTSSLRDSDSAVCRAAAHSIQLIVSGVSGNSFSVLGGKCLSTLYKSLKSCVTAKTDDIVLHHCAIAIETLDKEVKDTLFPKTSPLEKSIYVLDAPPNPSFDL